MENTLTIAIISLLVTLQVAATLRLRKSPSYSRAQKRRQFGMIWTIPLVGAALVMSVLHLDGKLVPKALQSSADTSEQA